MSAGRSDGYSANPSTKATPHGRDSHTPAEKIVRTSSAGTKHDPTSKSGSHKGR
jgi:hypothetical protein